MERESQRLSYLPDLPDPWPKPPDFVPQSHTAEAFQQTSVAAEPRAPTGAVAWPAEVGDRERITLAGQLGQDPRTRTTPKGRLITQFPLGVKDQPDIDHTSWRQVIAFDKRAEQVRDTLKRGDAVEVIGYVHQRDVPGRTGPRTIEEIYATVIGPR